MVVRVDSAGYQDQVLAAAERRGRAPRRGLLGAGAAVPPAAAARPALTADPDTEWSPALGHESGKGSQIAQTRTSLLGRDVRLIVRRQPNTAGAQLAFDDLDGWRLHAIITNVTAEPMSAAGFPGRSRTPARRSTSPPGIQGLTDVRSCRSGGPIAGPSLRGGG